MDVLTNELTWTSITKEIHEVPDDYRPKLDAAIKFYKEGWSKELIEKCVAEAAANGTPYDVELILLTAKGKERWVRTMGEAEMKEGTCVRLFGVIQDLDTQIRLRKERENIANRHKAVLDATNSATWEWDMLTNRVYVDGNFIKLAGSSHLSEEVEVLSDKYGWYVTIDTLRSIILPPDLPGFLQNLAEHFQGKKDVFEAEYRVYQTDERTVWIYNRGRVIERDERDNPTKMVGSLTDVSNIRQLSDQVREKDGIISSVADNVNGAIYRYALYPNGKDRVLYLNKGAEEFFGLSLNMAKMRARLLFERIHPEDVSHVMNEIKQAVENLHPLTNLFRLQSEDGSYRWIKNTALVQKQEDGTLIWDGFTVDVTEEIENERRFKMVFEQSPLAKFIFNPSDGVILNMNVKALELYGYQRKELEGKSISILRGTSKPDKKLSQIFQHVLQSDDTENFIGKHVRKDGREMMVEAAATKVDLKGVHHILVTFKDITTELARKQELQKLSLVADSSTNGVIITDSKQRIEYVNKGFERITGYTFDEVKGKNPRMLQGKETLEEHRAELREAIKNKKATYTEIRNYTKDGEP